MSNFTDKKVPLEQQRINNRKEAAWKALKTTGGVVLVGGGVVALALYLNRTRSLAKQSEIANNVLASGVMDQAKDAATLDPAKLNGVANKLVEDQLNGKPLPINSHGKPVHHAAVQHKVAAPTHHTAVASAHPKANTATHTATAPTAHKPAATHTTNVHQNPQNVPPKHNIPGQSHHTGPAVHNNAPGAPVGPNAPVADATPNPLDAGAMPPSTKVLSVKQIGAICVGAVVLVGIIGVLVYKNRTKTNEQKKSNTTSAPKPMSQHSGQVVQQVGQRQPTSTQPTASLTQLNTKSTPSEQTESMDFLTKDDLDFIYNAQQNSQQKLERLETKPKSPTGYLDLEEYQKQQKQNTNIKTLNNQETTSEVSPEVVQQGISKETIAKIDHYKKLYFSNEETKKYTESESGADSGKTNQGIEQNLESTPEEMLELYRWLNDNSIDKNSDISNKTTAEKIEFLKRHDRSSSEIIKDEAGQKSKKDTTSTTDETIAGHAVKSNEEDLAGVLNKETVMPNRTSDKITGAENQPGAQPEFNNSNINVGFSFSNSTFGTPNNNGVSLLTSTSFLSTQNDTNSISHQDITQRANPGPEIVIKEQPEIKLEELPEILMKEKSFNMLKSMTDNMFKANNDKII